MRPCYTSSSHTSDRTGGRYGWPCGPCGRCGASRSDPDRLLHIRPAWPQPGCQLGASGYEWLLPAAAALLPLPALPAPAWPAGRWWRNGNWSERPGPARPSLVWTRLHVQGVRTALSLAAHSPSVRSGRPAAPRSDPARCWASIGQHRRIGGAFRFTMLWHASRLPPSAIVASPRLRRPTRLAKQTAEGCFRLYSEAFSFKDDPTE